jgi:propanediol dehydratase small subunit
MRHRFTVVFLVVVCAVDALATHLASAGTAGETRCARTSPTAASQTTAVSLASGKSAVDCMDRAVLTGKLTPAQLGVQFEVWMKRFDRPAFENVGRSETRNDGSFRLRPSPASVAP